MFPAHYFCTSYCSLILSLKIVHTIIGAQEDIPDFRCVLYSLGRNCQISFFHPQVPDECNCVPDSCNSSCQSLQRYKNPPRKAVRDGMHPGRNELRQVFLHFAKHLFCEHFLILCQGNVINSGKDHIRVDALLLVLCAYSERLCKDKVKLP